MKNAITLTVAAAVLIMGTTASAGDIGLGVGAGTAGVSVEVKTSVAERFVLRGSYNYLDFEVDETFDEIDYNGDLNLSNFGGFLDAYPFGGGFNISGGALIGEKSVDIVATPSSNVDIGDMTFTPAEVGSLAGDVNLKDFAPYLGIGYDNFRQSRNISFNIRAGVMFTGSPEANLTSIGGSLSSSPELINEIQTEIQRLEDDADDFKYYPVFSIGLAKKF